MKIINIKSTREKIEGLPYQLTEWLDEEWKLESMVEPFKKHKEEKEGVIAKSPTKWAIFTTGKNIIMNKPTARLK